MKRSKLFSAIMLIMLAGILLFTAGCFGGNNGGGNNTSTPTNTVLKPKPTILPVVAATNGTDKAYFTTLAIKIKNEGAEGIVLVKASVTQSGITNTNEMPVYLMKGETDEIKLTFPLVWKGGEFTYDVQAALP